MAQQLPHQQNAGNLQVRTVLNAVAGVEISLTAPDNIRYRVMAAVVSLTTTGGLSIRSVSLQYLIDAAIIVWPRYTSLTIGASTNIYYFTINGEEATRSGQFSVWGRLPAEVMLPPESVVSTNVLGLVAGDTINSLSIYSEEWISR